MASIVDNKFLRDDMTSTAMGGTELLAERLLKYSDDEVRSAFQIHFSRPTVADTSKKQILYVHDLAGDPAVEHLKNEGWKKYKKIVFVSHWQQQRYAEQLGVPYSVGVVIPNAIDPIEPHGKKKDGKIRLIYTSTPHRGLNILVPVFEMLRQIHTDVELDVYSSFNLYGWGQRDTPFLPLFEKLKSMEGVRYHGAVSNEEVRTALKQADVLAYPSIWQETSCLCLIEAMSAGLVCVHSSLAALPETSGGLTEMYEYSEDINEHAQRFLHVLNNVVSSLRLDNTIFDNKLNLQKAMADTRFNTVAYGQRWNNLLDSL